MHLMLVWNFRTNGANRNIVELQGQMEEVYKGNILEHITFYGSEAFNSW